MVYPVCLILFFLFIVVLPIVCLIWFYFSKKRSCPFCGEHILKSESKCPSCKSTMPEMEKYGVKADRVAKAYQEGAKQFLDDGRKPKD